MVAGNSVHGRAYVEVLGVLFCFVGAFLWGFVFCILFSLYVVPVCCVCWFFFARFVLFVCFF